MKRTLIQIIVFFVLSLQLNAQINLVPNYSFEEKDSCPSFRYELTPTCKEWFDPISKMPILPPNNYTIFNWGAATYFHKCGGVQVNVPNNLAGLQYARSGDAYAGTTVLVHEPNIIPPIPTIYMAHHYIEVELKEVLKKNSYYKATFYYSHAEVYSNPDPNYFMQTLKFVRLGMLFTDTLVYNLPNSTYSGQPYNIYGTPQISAMMGPNIDTSSWIEVSGTFKAKGDEKFLTLGCFEKMDTINKHVYTFVYFDDVSVEYIGEDTIFPADTMIIPNIFTPNGDGINDKFDYKNQEQWEFETQIYNRWGELVFDNKSSENWDGTFKGNKVSAGVYFYMIKATAIKNGEIRVYKGTVTVMY